MGTIAGISFDEVIGSNTGRISEDSVSLIRRFDVAWSQRFEFIAAMLGGSVAVAGETVRTLAQPYMTGSRYRALTAGFEGRGKASVDSAGMIAYEQARVEIEFGLPPDADRADGEPTSGSGGAPVWAEEDAQFTVAVQQIPGYRLRVKDAPAGAKNAWIAEPTGIPIITGTITFTRYDVAALKRSTLIAALNTVNTTAFMGYPAGTLLMGGFSPKRTINALGESSTYTLSLAMLYKSIGHNFFYVPGYSDPQEVLVNNEDPLFSKTEFANL